MKEEWKAASEAGDPNQGRREKLELQQKVAKAQWSVRQSERENGVAPTVAPPLGAHGGEAADGDCGIVEEIDD